MSGHVMNKASINQMEALNFVYYRLIKVLDLRKIHDN